MEIDGSGADGCLIMCSNGCTWIPERLRNGSCGGANDVELSVFSKLSVIPRNSGHIVIPGLIRKRSSPKVIQSSIAANNLGIVASVTVIYRNFLIGKSPFLRKRFVR